MCLKLYRLFIIYTYILTVCLGLINLKYDGRRLLPVVHKFMYNKPGECIVTSFIQPLRGLLQTNRINFRGGYQINSANTNNDHVLPTHQEYIYVHSKNASATNTYFGDVIYNTAKLHHLNASEGADNQSHYNDEHDTELRATPDFFSEFLESAKRKKNVNLSWRHPMPCEVSQSVALYAAKSMMPSTLLESCFNVTDGSNIDDIIDGTCMGYYTNKNIYLFHRFQPEFFSKRNGTDVVYTDLKPPLLTYPTDIDNLEGNKSKPTVPLGWRIFAVLGLFPQNDVKSDPSLLWCARKTQDGKPVGKLASGLFQFGNDITNISSRDAVKPDNTFLYLKDPVTPGELFCGYKGDLSLLTTEPPTEYSTLNKTDYKYRISNDFVWPRKHFDIVIGSLTLSQTLWARLSTTMLRSTSKMLRFYKLTVRKNYRNEIFSKKNHYDIYKHEKETKTEPVETNVGVLYFMAAPTLHHAMQFVTTDPVSKCNLYKRLLVFEAKDVLKENFITPKEPDDNSPRQYLVFGRYNPGMEYANILNERMLRFLIRSNCVKTYASLKFPRKDTFVDFRFPVQQFLPVNEKYRDLIIDRDDRIRDACNLQNESSPLGDISIINQFDYDDAVEWANRTPYTRSGSYDSLFVAIAHEVGFYGRNCRFVAPLPMKRALTPLKQEYITIDTDPISNVIKRMTDLSGHLLTIPRTSKNLFPDIKLDNRKNKTKIGRNVPTKNNSWKNRLFITLKKSQSHRYTAKNISTHYSRNVKRRDANVNALSDLPYTKDNVLSVEVTNQPEMNEHISDKYPSCDIQTTQRVRITLDVLTKLADEIAPRELDRPFYADILRKYIYISLPEGNYFEPMPGCTNYAWNSDEPGDMNSPLGAEGVCRLDKYRPKAVPGFWMDKRQSFLIYNNVKSNYFIIGNTNASPDQNPTISEDMLKKILLKNEIYMDLVKRGAALSWYDLSQAYSRKENKLTCHLTPEEQLRTQWTAYPLNNYNESYEPYDELPPGRFYEKGVGEYYNSDDPRFLMSQRPDKLYQVQLEFMEKLNRGLVSIKDEPIKIMLDADTYDLEGSNDSITTWEEPDVELMTK